MSNFFVEKLSKALNKYLSSWVVFVMDFVLFVFSSAITLLIANMLSSSAVYSGVFAWTWLVSSALFSAFSIALFGGYKIIIRHASIKDTLMYILSIILKVALLTVWGYAASKVFKLFQLGPNFQILILIDFVITLVLVIVARVLMIAAYDVFQKKVRNYKKIKNILVYGTAEKSVAAASRFVKSPHYFPRGFITPEHNPGSHKIGDLNVYSIQDEKSFESLVNQLSIEAILYPTDKLLALETERFVQFSSKCGVSTLIVPGVDEYVPGNNPHHIREVRIEDLLGRDEIKISLDSIRSNLSGKVVMVTGAAGSIGSELCRQIAGFGVKQLVMFDNAETPLHNVRLEFEDRYKGLNFVPVIGDVRSVARLDYAFRRWRPQIVFHAAAYKHVPLMEENPCEAVYVNSCGSRNVADKCLEYGCEKMIMISTDKAVNPTNIMGCSKRLAEIYVQSLGLAVQNGTVKGNTQFITTRFGNVLGSNGSVIPRFRDQIAAGGPVTVTHPDINRFFMTIPEACRLVMEAATNCEGNHIVVFDMGEPVKIDTLARRMIELSGLRPDVDIEVKYTGLRPGEKLYEEVLSKVEDTDPTSHDRIRVARVRQYEYEKARDYVDELLKLSSEVDIPSLVQLMKQIVPEFISQNSEFSKYDKK